MWHQVMHYTFNMIYRQESTVHENGAVKRFISARASNRIIYEHEPRERERQTLDVNNEIIPGGRARFTRKRRESTRQLLTRRRSINIPLRYALTHINVICVLICAPFLLAGGSA